MQSLECNDISQIGQKGRAYDYKDDCADDVGIPKRPLDVLELGPAERKDEEYAESEDPADDEQCIVFRHEWLHQDQINGIATGIDEHEEIPLGDLRGEKSV